MAVSFILFIFVSTNQISKMGASNFHYQNASEVFSFDVEDEYDYKDYIGNINDELKAIEKVTKGLSYYPGSGKDPDELRSYPSRVIGTLKMYKEYAGVEIVVNIIAISRSGYYAGACLDWAWNYEVNGCEYEHNDFSEDLAYFGGISEARAKYIGNFAGKWAETTKDKMVELLEDVYTKFTLPLIKLGTFSNGESIYQRPDGLPFDPEPEDEDDDE